jgi:hypothetical protein
MYVFAEPPDPKRGFGPTFWLSMRSVEERHLEEGLQCAENVPITLETWLPIQFCPWCGKRLASFYRNSFDLLCDKDISARHQWGD